MRLVLTISAGPFGRVSQDGVSVVIVRSVRDRKVVGRSTVPRDDDVLDVGSHCFNALVTLFNITPHPLRVSEAVRLSPTSNVGGVVAGLEVTSTSLRIRPLSAVNDGFHNQEDVSAPIVLRRFDTRPRLYKPEVMRLVYPLPPKVGENLLQSTRLVAKPSSVPDLAPTLVSEALPHYTTRTVKYETQEFLANCHKWEAALSAVECAHILQAASDLEFTNTKNEYPDDYRNSSRMMWSSAELADALWDRFAPLVLEKYKDLRPVGFRTGGKWIPCGVNSYFRLSRYEPGQQFSEHSDVRFCKDTTCSALSLVIYLNDAFTGGETSFRIPHAASLSTSSTTSPTRSSSTLTTALPTLPPSSSSSSSSSRVTASTEVKSKRTFDSASLRSSPSSTFSSDVDDDETKRMGHYRRRLARPHVWNRAKWLYNHWAKWLYNHWAKWL
jgi:hypothetical protein